MLWIGEQPLDDVAKELRERRLKVLMGNTQRALELSRTGRLQAVLLPYTNALRDQLELIYTQVLHSGAHVEIVLSTEAADSERQLAAIAINNLAGIRVPSKNEASPAQIAERCARHPAGPPVNPNLQLAGYVITDEGRRILLQRAFHDFHTITIRHLAGEPPRPTVIRVIATEQDGYRTQPFVVKIGKTKEIAGEIKALNSVVGFVPFRNRAPLVESRCITGPKESLLTSLFVERAVTFDEYLSSHEPELAIAAIFAGPLRNWRDDIVEQDLNLRDHYRRYDFLPSDPGSLQQAHDEASGKTPTHTPLELLDRFASLGNQRVYTCYSHGDLHVRNIFVTYGGTDVVLIDFARATRRERQHAALDLAVLDVSLSFMGADNHLPSFAAMRQLYAAPLLTPRQEKTNGETEPATNRLRAIRDLRNHAHACCGAKDYEVAIAATLLRVAKYEAFSLDRRALAYLLADELMSYATAA